jgi:cytochrome c-type biogenesis protein CcmF
MLVPFGPMLAWKRGDIGAAAERLMVAFGLAIIAGIVAAFLSGGGPVLALFGIGLGVWLIAGALSETASRIKLGQAPLAESMRRAAGLPRAAYGSTLAHAGVGVMVIGIVAATAWPTETIRTMKPGDSVEVAGRSITLDGFLPRAVSNYRENAVRFTVREGGSTVAIMEPSKRQFTVRATETTEAAIKTFGLSQLYVSLGDIGEDGTTTVRIYWKPLVTLIWIGPLIMALGGLVSLSDRRLRVGAPSPARRAASVPAE